VKVKDLVLKTRSVRRFDEKQAIGRDVLEELVDLGRLSASGGNLQPLKYMLFCDAKNNERIFPHLMWAGYLKEWPGPDEGERPAAYIVMLNDATIARSAGCDHGIAAQSILLGATERGLAGCMIGALDRRALAETLNVPGRYEILLVLALGVAAETVRLIEADGSIEYYRDEDDVHRVPKRALRTVIIN
jgi:nitroreductase